MTAYPGGAHAAELVAVDGVGNSAVKRWTINVDPEGHISTTELSDTLAAVEATSGLDVTTAPIDETSNGEPVSLNGTSEGFDAVGSYMPILVPRDPSGSIQIEALGDNAEEWPEEELLQIFSISPISTAPGATEAVSPEGDAALSANTGQSADTIVRPIFDGALSFQDIRDYNAPEEYSWEVQLLPGQYMSLMDPQHAEVYFQSGHPAFAIAAMPAADAVGTAIPTHLKVEGDVVTEVVEHRSVHPIYPVVAGVGWRGGYITGEIPGPKDEQELREERERQEREAKEAQEAGAVDYIDGPISMVTYVGAPKPSPINEPGEEADASSSSTRYISEWATDICAPLGVCGVWKVHFKGFFYFDFKEAWFPKNRDPRCEPFAAVNYSINREECAWVGPNHQTYGHGYHITARTLFAVTADYAVTSKTSYKHVVGRAFGDGKIYFHDTADICNPSVPDC